MPLIEKGKVIGHENWGFDPEASVDYPTYQSNPTSNVVITLLPEQDLSGFAEYSQLVRVIIIPFDSFADGRIFSVSQQLRQSYNYMGKIVLSGPMIADQYGTPFCKSFHQASIKHKDGQDDVGDRQINRTDTCDEGLVV